MNKVTVFILLCVFAGTAHGSCKDISGTWQNQLGSNMTILRLEGNELFGEYSTAVEREGGASLHTSNIAGTVTHLEDGALFAFTVLFNHGKSLATWVGQCMMCDREEVLYTTWILRSYQMKPVDRWMSNTINQDTFKRFRGESRNSIPKHLKMMGPPAKVERLPSCEKNLNVKDNGFWASEADAIQFSNCYETGKLTGRYQGQSLHGKVSVSHSLPIHGRKSFTALGLVSSSPQEVKGWTGHIYENSREKERKVVSSWLTHSFSDSCENPRASVQYGVHKYAYDVNYRHTEVKDVKESMGRKALNYILSYFL